MRDLSRLDLPRLAADIAARLRARRPRVHCITNNVAQAYTANMLLAAGAIPSMTISPEEIGDFVARSDALLVNLGTFDAERRRAVELALGVAREKKIPVLLDPALIDRSPGRAGFARTLAADGMAAIRLNAAEFSALSGNVADEMSISHFAEGCGSVVAVSAAIDVVSDGKCIVRIGNGHAFMALVTAMGCAVSAIAAACLAVEADRLTATASALLMAGVAGEIAAERARGPGSFATEIIDCLHNLPPGEVSARAKVT